MKAITLHIGLDVHIRDLCRARTHAVDDLRRSRQRLKSFLLRHDYHCQGKANWSQPHMRYLRALANPRGRYAIGVSPKG